MAWRVRWLWIFVGCLGVFALLGVAALLLPRIPYEGEMLGSSALLSAYSLLALAGSLAIGRRKLVPLAWTAMALLTIALLLWLTMIWFHRMIPGRHEDTVVRLGGTFSTLGILGLHHALLRIAPLRGWPGRAVKWGTLGAAALSATIIIILNWGADWIDDDDLIARVMGAGLICSALGTIAIPVMVRIESVSRRFSEEHTLARTVPVRLMCPRCGTEREAPSNRRSVCPSCGLSATVQLEEPRCACGYLLYGLSTPICPECGKDVPLSRWWGDTSPEASPDRDR